MRQVDCTAIILRNAGTVRLFKGQATSATSLMLRKEVSIEDVAAAQYILERARTTGVGATIEF